MYKCANCNSTNVEEKMWVNMNTLELSDNYLTECDLDNINEHYCNDCQCNVEIIDDSAENYNNWDE